ncbi:hypothetical protein TVAG_351360 [Trichomonas vaginalis G3]|uniref:Uncharacterized protein n=1 Tax=Trichomonas vaginalis (strain ATCC PRA-98 / G3) TaxID=412133 RepID=A2DZM0_TRIV3|nr:hypothetical protein TVAGG3_0260850 [Trichomonas vaginalis G3]EAY14088.1 hypothetical protein TVAG_351360 [Trichomonas vaginalis G3]KAI5525098.1 hypothetical protein TVAGG3_0260850 [Trichomonas vaginalis G3]|eukprot:XP_001326311.1 hypothetical protein [Trichomonas vaginalis G3]
MPSNISLLHLSISKLVSQSPMFTHGFHNLDIRHSSFSSFSSKLIHSSSFFNINLKNTYLTNFTTTAIQSDKKIYNSQIFTSPLEARTKSLSISNCRFVNVQSSSGCIVYNDNSGSLALYSTSFSNCHSIDGPVTLYTVTSTYSIEYCCFLDCSSTTSTKTNILTQFSNSGKLSSVSFYNCECKASSSAGIYIKTDSFRSNMLNISKFTTIGTCLFIMSKNSDISNDDEIHTAIFDTVKSKYTLGIYNFTSFKVTQTRFENNTAQFIMDVALNTLVQVSFSEFYLLDAKLLHGSNSSIVFNNCNFDKTFTFIEGLPLKNCKFNYEGKKLFEKLPDYQDKCWSTIQNDPSSRDRVSAGKVFNIIILLIVFVVAILCAIRYIRINYFEDHAGRDVLERLNVFEGEENPEIKMMLMDIKNGRTPDKGKDNTETDVLKIDVDEDEIAKQV